MPCLFSVVVGERVVLPVPGLATDLEGLLVIVGFGGIRLMLETAGGALH